VARLALLFFLLLAAPASAVTLEIGESSQGRPIYAKQFGDPSSERVALFVGLVHGDEPEGPRVTRALRGRVPDDVQLWIIDVTNPDGLALRRRQNARGVDLNRNFPYKWQKTRRGDRYYGGRKPLSEPESRALASFVERVKPDVTVWYHQPYGAVLVPCDRSPRLQRLYARVAGMPLSCRASGLRGTITSWMNNEVGGHSFVVELPGGRVSSGLIERNARAAARVAVGR
jgi:murein peptide amidase A